MEIGIIGLGVVGGSLYKTLRKYHSSVYGYDSDKTRSLNNLEDFFSLDAVFLTLPTPLGRDGRLDASLIKSYLTLLETHDFQGLVIIRSTLPLGFMAQTKSLKLRVIYNPEFIHERYALAETEHPTFVVSSGKMNEQRIHKLIFYWLPREIFIYADDRTIEMTKLVMNAFAATKISFVNEIERICESHYADVNKVFEILRHDKRCGSEYATPHKGGYSGSCLPKDTSELRHSVPDAILLNAVEEVNRKVLMLEFFNYEDEVEVNGDNLKRAFGAQRKC